MKRLKILSFIPLSLFPLLVCAEDVFYDALMAGKPTLNMRLRYEQVDQANINNKAEALTLRTRLGYETGALFNTSAYVEMEDVRVVGGQEDYAPETTGFPVVADPRVTELNQAYLSIKPIKGANIIAGRQRINIGNGRFVGNIGFRQDEQTFDALTLKMNYAKFQGLLSYVDRVNGITPKFDNSVRDILSHLSYKFEGIGKIAVSHYRLEDAKTHVENKTTGLGFSGDSLVFDNFTLIYVVEYAYQDAMSSNSAEYTLTELGIGVADYSVIFGSEILGADKGGYVFQTPLATKHAFNGWADKFLTTPLGGLKDQYVKVTAKVMNMKLVALYHDFEADRSSEDFGDEWNLLLLKPFAKKYKVGLKYADYSADRQSKFVNAIDTEKLWVWAELSF